MSDKSWENPQDLLGYLKITVEKNRKKKKKNPGKWNSDSATDINGKFGTGVFIFIGVEKHSY